MVVGCFFKRESASQGRYFQTKNVTPRNWWRKLKEMSWQVDLIPHFVVLQKGGGRTSAANACCDDLISAGYDNFFRRHLGVVFSLGTQGSSDVPRRNWNRYCI